MKQIPDYPNYYIDENGNILNIKRNRYIKLQTQKDGYVCASLCKNGVIKRCRVHRLVAQAYIPNPNNYPCINHKDENKSNNNVNNLEWCTYAYNNSYGNSQPTIKAIEARKIPVIQMGLNGEIIAEYESSCDAMRKTGFNQTNISSCCVGKIHTAYGYIWKHKQIK